MSRILILEDHDDQIEFYKDTLTPEFEIEVLSSLEDFQKRLKDKSQPAPRMLIADLMLVDGTLLEMVRNPEWFQHFKTWPTIVVSVTDDVAVLEDCYAWGARDYLTKPINGNELLVRCRRIYGLSALPFQFSPVTMTVAVSGRASERLTAQESKIFHFLSTAWGRGVSKQQLMREVWGEDKPSKKLDVHVSRLRKKLSSVGLAIGFQLPDLLLLRSDGTGAPTTGGGAREGARSG